MFSNRTHTIAPFALIIAPTIRFDLKRRNYRTKKPMLIYALSVWTNERMKERTNERTIKLYTPRCENRYHYIGMCVHVCVYMPFPMSYFPLFFFQPLHLFSLLFVRNVKSWCTAIQISSKRWKLFVLFFFC